MPEHIQNICATWLSELFCFSLWFFLLLLFSILFLSLFVLFSLSVSCIYSQINVLRSDICLNIYRTFVQHGYVNCSVTPFGSSVNGLGQRGCDLDVYIDLGTVLLTVL